MHTRICFVRHGLAAISNDPSLTDKFSSLSARGAKQAERAGVQLADQDFAEVYAAPDPVCVQTAEIIARHTARPQPATLMPALASRRIDPLLKDLMLPQHYIRLWTYESAEFHSYFNEETLNDVEARLRGFLGEVTARHQGRTVLVVSHLDIVWFLQSIIHGHPAHLFYFIDLRHCEPRIFDL